MNPQPPVLLRALTAADEAAFLEAYRAFQDPAFAFALAYEAERPFADYLARLADNEAGRRLPEGHVPSTLQFGFVGTRIVGRVSFRHELNDFLSKFGGHLGYGVVPAFRGRGYARAMLRQALDWARARGLDQVLVTCDQNNPASRKVIEACGGRFESALTQDGQPPKTFLRFWIDLERPPQTHRAPEA